jgi:two-component system LytT family response regulator
MIPRLRCLIVDDEALAREALRSYVDLDPDLEVVGEAKDGPDALDLLPAARPDLLFLDVQMPEMSGFELLAQIMSKGLHLPTVIFVTAYDRYALEAFEVHAADYLLKPIREERFRDAVATARSRIAADRGWYERQRLAALLAVAEGPRVRRLPVRAGGRIEFVSLDEVEWVGAEGNYVRLHLTDRSCVVRETLNAMEAILDPARFMRIHRSAIVNIDRIKDLRPWFTGEYIVRMASGHELTLTRSYRDNLRRLIGREPESSSSRMHPPTPDSNKKAAR